MIGVPFIYFGLLLIYQLRKNKWKIDIASYILIIYCISGFFSILIDVFELRSLDTINYKISYWATFCYCGLLTLCIWPFMKYSNLRIKKILPIKNSIILKIIGWIFLFYFILNFLLSFSDLIKVITSDDLKAIRGEHYKGYDTGTWLSKLSPILRIPFIILNSISSVPWIFIFIGFYLVFIQKENKKYGIIYFLASINGIVDNIIDAGRSAIIFWVIGFIACYIFFIPFMTKTQKKIIIKYTGLLGLFFLIFLTAVTISRFSERDSGEVNGTQGSLISYAGQPFINYCYYWDNFYCPLPTLQIILPLTYKVLGSPLEGGVEIQQLLTNTTGYQLGVFYTFLGQIATTSFNITSIIYCFIVFLFAILILSKLKRHNCKIFICYIYLLISSIIFLGLFGHYYSSWTKSTTILFFMLLFFCLKSKNNKTKIIKPF